jgi:hypothetical protein
LKPIALPQTEVKGITIRKMLAEKEKNKDGHLHAMKPAAERTVQFHSIITSVLYEGNKLTP